MRYGETILLQVRILDDGAFQARRKDGKALTEADRAEARRLADSLPGVTADDVMRIFPGAKLVSAAG
jgi:hypothetical protein